MIELGENIDYLGTALISMAAFAALHLWLRTGDRAPGVPIAAWVVLGLILGVGAVATDQAGAYAREKLVRAISGFAPTYAQELERLGHAGVDLDTEADDAGYLAMIDAQRRWLAVNPVVNDIYTFRRADGAPGVQLIVDSETDYDRNGRYEGEREARTDIGEELDLEGEFVDTALAGTGVFDPRPEADRWGVWVSAYWPLRDTTGRVEAVLGVDYDARAWLTEIRNARWTAMGAMLATVLLLFTGTVFIVLQRAELEARRRAALALQEAKDAAESANTLKSQFLACMSHEIRTPINGVMGVTELLMQTPLDAKQRHFADLVMRSATALLDLINDILDYSKIEADKLTLEEIEFEPLQIAEDVAELLAPRTHGKGLELNLKLPTGPPLRVYGDPTRLRQVLLNLVGNAVKFTAVGEVTIAIEWDATTTEHGRLRCEVRDTGPGIDAATRARLFEAFMQADSSTTRRYGGTGLGLAICKRLVTLMNGTLGCDPRATGGTTFWFELPYRIAPAQRIANGDEGTDLTVLRGRRVLIVDDNETNREILEHVLAAWRMEHVSAASGLQALQVLDAAASRPFEVVLLDMEMPGLDGIELARRIRARAGSDRLRLLMCSSVGNLAEVRSWRDAGIDAHLSKPLRQAVLARALVELISGVSKTEPVAPSTETPTMFAARVLLAEDNPVNQLVATEALRRHGLEVVVVADGRAAVDAACAPDARFDLILMDCEMPELDGYAATARIREFEAGCPARARLPIVALTANVMASDRAACLAAGMDDYIGKPFNRAELRRVLGQWLTHAPVNRAA